MNPILQGFEEGYGDEEILSFISKAIPQMIPSIKKATRSGYGIKQILGFLSKNFDKESLKGKSESQIHAINRRADAERTKYGLKVAATAVAAPLVASAAGNALTRALPTNLKNVPTGMSPNISPGALLPSQQNPSSLQQNPAQSLSGASASAPTQQMPQETDQLLNASQQPPVSPNITQTQPVPQPQGIVNPKEYLEKLGIKDKVDNLLKAGNSPEQAAAALGIKRSGEAKIDPELLANIDAYSKESKPEAAIETEQPKEIKPIAKNEMVMSPHGIAEVKEIRNGKALIEAEGKKYQVNEDELEASPLSEKDLADLYDELIQGIESETGEDVSRMVQWAGYNPETNTLQFLPHTGKLYKYSNISPEDAGLLRDILSVRKTSGENFIGAWKAGSKSPIGAALSKLIKRLQAERGGKGNEYEETHEPIYSAYEPAIQAKKKKKKK